MFLSLCTDTELIAFLAHVFLIMRYLPMKYVTLYLSNILKNEKQSVEVISHLHKKNL